MQQKRIISKPGRLALLAAIALVCVMAGLMRTTIPAPQKSVEKELDAQSFLESKPQ